ncbi:hypothetical protein AVEN_267638-1 [Araneus ventricosus]|uniref:SF3 helicase domain-containing protein n=1 Tax=Araneus ventricosus TaxID=182803 RepID=A0A4Y2PHL9_ARAVE|nr:hypothetical protein AVEN_267638-1 [Araneus ventricosus]
MDLAAANSHSLILDIDATLLDDAPRDIPESLFDLIHSNLNLLFLPAVPHFTYIVATRPHSCGVHVYLPEFCISHDDYIQFCERLKPNFSVTLNSKRYSLDILTNAMLSGSAKPNSTPYQPFRVVYSDERIHHMMHLKRNDFLAQFENLKKHFKRRKDNEHSLFRKLLCHQPNEITSFLKQFMMPVVNPSLFNLSYQTRTLDEMKEVANFNNVASYALKRDNSVQYVFKGHQLLFSGSDFLKMYNDLKRNAFTFSTFDTTNYALKRWYEKYAKQQPIEMSCPKEFRQLNQMLKEDSASFQNDTNPIKSILQYNEGFYFLPVFFALRKTLDISSHHLANILETLLDPKFHDLLKRVARIHENHTAAMMDDLTQNTIYYCGNHLYERPATMRDKLARIVHDGRRSILSITSQPKIIDVVRNLQQNHFPIRVMALFNALKKPARYYWNFLTESWQDVSVDREVHDHVMNLWLSIKTYLHEMQEMGTLGGPDDSILDKFNVASVVSTIMSDSTTERKVIQMDRHKWLIRLSDGTLDLLTGHIGGTVPEFFLSDRELGLKIPRLKLMELLSETQPLRELYRLLTNKSFFLRYLKLLYLDKTPHMFETLKWMVSKELPSLNEVEYVSSMLHFYTHLCKYMSFEYDMLMYILDVLASAFIATNYERKFFVLKGLTSNGKSKLFELLGKVFGGYFHNIQSDNLKPGSATSNATPELASTLFSCRVLTLEELDGKLNENRVKQITGNSHVTFRNMYENNVGGIPTTKVFCTTNKLPECQATKAFEERVVALPFHATFSDKAPTTTAEQVRQNVYPKDTYVIESSYEGCFLMLYYHLNQFMNMEDGLLHYREAPDAVKEYTQDYLANTNVYTQFKLYMDVQVLPEATTTMNDLRSAVRQFLKAMKNLSIHESELITKFDEEFAVYRQSDLNLGSFRYVSVLDRLESSQPPRIENASLQEDDDEEDPVDEEVRDEPASKRMKSSPTTQQSVVFYYGIVIKNLKRSMTEN